MSTNSCWFLYWLLLSLYIFVDFIVNYERGRYIFGWSVAICIIGWLRASFVFVIVCIFNWLIFRLHSIRSQYLQFHTSPVKKLFIIDYTYLLPIKNKWRHHPYFGNYLGYIYIIPTLYNICIVNFSVYCV